MKKEETVPVQEQQDKQTQIIKETACLRTSKVFANSRQKLVQFQDEKAQEFSVVDDIGSKAFK